MKERLKVIAEVISAGKSDAQNLSLTDHTQGDS